VNADGAAFCADQPFEFAAGKRIALRAERPHDATGLIHERPTTQLLVVLERKSMKHRHENSSASRAPRERPHKWKLEHPATLAVLDHKNSIVEGELTDDLASTLNHFFFDCVEVIQKDAFIIANEMVILFDVKEVAGHREPHFRPRESAKVPDTMSRNCVHGVPQG
jgi:hypothetical protein